jgi:arylsulfatase A-like enzyme
MARWMGPKTAAWARVFAPTMGVLACVVSAAWAEAEKRPNILWITSEDNGPHLGAYGDAYADTPALDRLARRGLVYRNVWSNAPVCAPARTAIITGVYPPSLGAEHMRSMAPLPAGMKMFPQLLREAGYYCTNNRKEDYNVTKPGRVWDESSRKAHWRNRQPGQPFFAVFNLTVTHESQIRRRPHTAVHDPAKVRVPAYHPDTPEVRQDWAQYYDKLTEMDAQAGRILAKLEADGLRESTIVFYFADHGPGMPRCKRTPCNSGLSVPLIVAVPRRFQGSAGGGYETGSMTDRLVGFVDLGPTVLTLAGIRAPDSMQGHAFLGRYAQPARHYVYGFRGRMDERYDMARSVRDERYVYVRNYMPHRPFGQHNAYMFETPTTRVWKDLFDRGLLTEAQRTFWEPKPAEELYDLENDPDEVNNLASTAAHQDVLRRLRRAVRDWEREIRDVGFLPEDEIHTRSVGTTPYELGHDDAKYPMARIMAAAELAASRDAGATDELIGLLGNGDSAVRYWAATGLLIRGEKAVAAGRARLEAALADASPCVRIVAAEALGRYGTGADAGRAVSVLVELANVERHGPYVAIFALNALDELDDKARIAIEEIRNLPQHAPSVPARMRNNIPRLIEKTLADLREPGDAPKKQ